MICKIFFIILSLSHFFIFADTEKTLQLQKLIFSCVFGDRTGEKKRKVHFEEENEDQNNICLYL